MLASSTPDAVKALRRYGWEQGALGATQQALPKSSVWVIIFLLCIRRVNGAAVFFIISQPAAEKKVLICELAV